MRGLLFTSHLEFGEKNLKTIHLAAIISSSIELVELPLPRNTILDLPVANHWKWLCQIHNDF